MMNVMQKAGEAREYQDFAPQTELLVQPDCDTLLVYVSGFRKDQLKVQLTKTRNLIISGEHPIGENTWRRFQKTFPVSKNCDVSKISAKFEDLILHIRLPKILVVSKEQDQEKGTSTSSTIAPGADHKPIVNEQQSPNDPNPVTNSSDNAQHFLEKTEENENEQDMNSDEKGSRKRECDSDNGIKKLKMARKVTNCVLVLLFAVGIGIYVHNSLGFWENDDK